MNSSIFRNAGLVRGNKSYFNVSQLEKIADPLGLPFDKSRTARKIYDQAINRNEIEKIRDDDGHECYALTEEGRKLCIDKLNELRRIISSPRMPQAIAKREEELRTHFMTSGRIEDMRKPKLYDPEVDKLLERIDKISRNIDDID